MDKLIKILTTPTAKRSAFFYFGSFASSVGNYLFHLLLMRTLAPAVYGEFLSYISFLYLITIPAGTVSTVVAKYVADFYGQNDKRKINQFFYLMLQKVFIPTLLLAALTMIFSPMLAEPLKAQKLAFIILGINIITQFLGAIIQSYLIALQRFVFQIISGLTQIVIKIMMAYFLITMGLGAIGAVIATLLSGAIGLVIVWLKIKSFVYPKLNIAKSLDINLKSFLTYSFIFSAGSLSLISVDVLLVRYFFSPHGSGVYSAIAVLGRMIFFGLTPFAVLLLPIASKRYASKQSTKSVWWKLSGVTFLFGSLGVGLFSAVPEQVIKILSGIQYIDGSYLLWMFALAMMFFALSRLLLTYLIAINHTRAVLILLVAILMQPLLIILWHHDLKQVAINNLIIQSGLLLGLLCYYKLALRRVD